MKHLFTKLNQHGSSRDYQFIAGSLSIHHRLRTLKHLAFMLLFLLGSLNVWGDTDVITMTGFAGNTTSNSYINTATEGTTQNGITVYANQYVPKTGQVKGNQTTATSQFVVYNTVAFPGSITKIKIEGTGTFQNNLYASMGTSSQANVTTVNTSTMSDWNTSREWNFDASNGYTFFKLLSNKKFTSGSVTGVTITITYETSSGPDKPTVSLEPSSVSVEATNVAEQSIGLTTANFAGSITSVTPVLYNDADCTEETTSGAWVKNITVNSAKTAVTFNVDDNGTGSRNCWMKITASDGAKSAFAILPISQAKYEGPASLPFSFAGGKEDIANTQGMSQAGLGSDYANVTTKLKFDNTGDNLIIYFNAAPGKLTFDIKGNSFSGGTFKVQESADGETYTDKYTYSADGNGVEVALSTTARFVKFVYVTKSSGNIGLGNINIAVPVAVEAPTIGGETPFLTSTTVTLTQAEADHIYYTTNGNEPTTSSTEYTTPFELTATATVKAIAVKGSDASAVAEATFTKATVMTVAEAKAAIDAAGSTPIENQYVAGIISQIDSYNGTYHSITYWISADGAKDNQLEVYSGKGINGANFAGISDLSLGDEVIVKGTLKKYSEVYEFDMNSQIIQLNRTIAAPTFTPDRTGFLTTTSVVLASATEGAEVRYTVDGSDPTSTSALYENPIELSATTTIKAAAFKDEFVSVIVARTFTKGTKISVADALAALDASSPIENQFVYGIVSTAPTSNPSSGRLTYYISDDGTATDQLEVYNGYGLNGASFAAKTDLQVGDEVTVYGTLKIHNEKKEFDGGNYLLEFYHPEIQTYSITYFENGANEDIDDVAEATNLPDPLPSVTKTGKIFGGWFTDSEFETPAVAGAALSKDVTLYAKWNDLSPWAYEYNSNVTVGDEEYTIVIDEQAYKGQRYGTSNAAGVATINVPANTHTLHFHAAAWNNENVTLEVTIGEETYPSTFGTLVKEANIKGTEKSYALSTPIDEYYVLDLSSYSITEPTDIIFTATSGKRFVLFGVNQEGGVLPVLDRIVISGDLTNKSGYKAGDELDMTGLTVNAIYTLNEVEQTPVDVTADVEWSYDALVENQTEVTVTATYGEKQAQKTIIGLDPVASADPVIYVDKLSVNFGTVMPNASVEAKTITVTLQNVDAATATLGGTNPDAFSISKTAIANGDVITISVVSTATLGSYSATITISDNAGEAEAKTVNLSLSVEEVEAPVSTTSEWVAAEAADLVDGAEVLITGIKSEVVYAMGGQNSNNRAAVAASVDGDGVLTPGANTMSFILEAQDGGKFALRTSNGKYLYAASSSANQLKTRDAIGDDSNASWTIEVDSAAANGTNRGVMQFNGNSSLFACYASASQTPIAFYVRKQEVTPEPPTPEYGSYVRDVTEGRYGTICLRNGGVMFGAAIYEIAYYSPADGKIYFDNIVNGEMEAGMPYVFMPSGNKITVNYTDEVNALEAQSKNGLYGSFSEQTLTADAGNYILYNNQYYEVDSEAKVGANRAYIKLGEISRIAVAPAPGRKRVAMAVNGEQVATDILNLNAANAPYKMLKDGKLYIIREGQMFDMTGNVVK